MNIETVDLHILMEHIDPQWRDHFLDESQAFDYYVQWSEPKWILEMINESGARND